MTSTRHTTRLVSLTVILIAMLVLALPQTSAQTVIQLDKLTVSDAGALFYFGSAVAVSGTTVVVGAPSDDDKGDNSGSAYVYDCSSYPCTQASKLIASDAAEGDRFGISVAVSGTTVVVGAPYNDGGVSASGSAYVYDCSSYPCTQASKLIASDAEVGEAFGAAVAVSEATVVVGAPYDGDGASASGSAYVFDSSTCGATCHEVSKLTPSGTSRTDFFGYAVAVSGTTVVVGAVHADDNGDNSGAAYVFDSSTCGATCHEVSKLTPSGVEREGAFGLSVAVSGTTVIVSAIQANDNGDYSGMAYVFDSSTCGATCHEVSKLTPSAPEAGTWFVAAVAVSGTTAVIGAVRKNNRLVIDSSVVYVFDLRSCGATCHEASRVTASDTTAGDAFGAAVAVSGTTVVVGAPLADDDPYDDSGSAYVFDLSAIRAKD